MPRILTYEYVKNKIEEAGYILLSDEYVGAMSKIFVLCPNGHKWETTYSKIQQKRTCPYCSGKFNNIQTIRDIIESEEGYTLISTNARQLRDKVEIEYGKGHQYNILIEYDGELHYKIIKQFGGVDNLIRVKIRDTIKNIYCQQNNIKLIRIPYWDFDNIEKILNKQLNK